MVKLNVTVDDDILRELMRAMNAFGTGFPPKTVDTLDKAANKIAKDWREYAKGGGLNGVEPLPRPNRSYLLGVKTRSLGFFEHEIYNESKAAQQIEEGMPELDMKTTHPYGPRSRISKKGVPYLIVPFRWGTPGTLLRNVMPRNVYNMVVKFKKMEELVDAEKSDKKSMNAHRVLPNGRSGKNGIEHAEEVGRAQYNKGYGRLSGKDFSGTIEDKSRMDGMVRTKDKTGKDRSGGYLTFRVISANSPAESWIRPRVEPRHVVDALVELNRESIISSVESAVKEDLRTIKELGL
jgi:hypothetical protein